MMKRLNAAVMAPSYFNVALVLAAAMPTGAKSREALCMADAYDFLRERGCDQLGIAVVDHRRSNGWYCPHRRCLLALDPAVHV